MNSKQMHTALYVTVGILIYLCSGCSSTSNAPLGQSHYKPADLGNEQLIPIISFWEQYHSAVQAGENWIADPIEIALRYAGFPNPDNINPDTVFAYYVKANKAVVIITKANLMDDSVSAKEYRIDLVKLENIWKIEWAGYRQKCGRGLSLGWVKGLCP